MIEKEFRQERWVGVEEVAAHLGVTKDSVYRWVESKGLPAHRLGRLFRFRLSEIDSWVGGNRGGMPDSSPEGDARVRAAIGEMVRRIVERFHPQRIVLFGSYARGGAGPDSDVDLLVIMPLERSKRDVQVEIRLALHDVRVPKDILVATPEEVRRNRDVVGSVLYTALREGTTLHERVA
ncbi:MAG: excisionase family DNA-binding protein [Gemmatimonadota bacterium]